MGRAASQPSSCARGQGDSLLLTSQPTASGALSRHLFVRESRRDGRGGRRGCGFWTLGVTLAGGIQPGGAGSSKDAENRENRARGKGQRRRKRICFQLHGRAVRRCHFIRVWRTISSRFEPGHGRYIFFSFFWPRQGACGRARSGVFFLQNMLRNKNRILYCVCIARRGVVRVRPHGHSRGGRRWRRPLRGGAGSWKTPALQ